MKKWIALLLAGIVALSIAGCSSGTKGKDGDYTSSAGEQEHKPIIDGYTYDQTDARNEYESGKTKLYLEGAFELSLEDGILSLIMRNESKTWSVEIGSQASYDVSILESLVDQPVQVFGTYHKSRSWSSNDLLSCEEIRTKTKNYTLTDLALDAELYFSKLQKEAVSVLYHQIGNEDYQTKPFVLEGLVTDITQSEALGDALLRLIQKSGEEYQEDVLIPGILYNTCVNIKEIQAGDYIRLYGKTTDTSINCYIGAEKIEPKFSLEEIKADFISKCEAIDYKSLARSPEDYRSKKVQVKGEVIQVLEDSTGVELRVDITQDEYGHWDDTIYVTSNRYDKNHRILEDDIVQIYGTAVGTKTYTSVLGAEVTLPKISAEYIDILEAEE